MNAHSCWRTIGVYGGDRSCEQLTTHIHCRSCPVFTAAGRALLDRSAPASARTEAAATVALPAPQARGTRPYLVFRIGTSWLALELGALVEVVSARHIHRIPHRDQSFLAGMVNIRGQLLLCASMHALLGLAPDADSGAHRRLIHFVGDRDPWTFLADEVDGVIDVATAEIVPAPASVSLAPTAYARGTFDWQGRSVTLLHANQMGAALRREVG
jgi:chemotaxis-related protein WspD